VLFLLKVVLAAFLEIIVYIFLHEAGHALVAVSCGAKITAFSIVGAFTSSTGGNYTQATYSLLNIAGMAFPLIISVCYMMLFFRKNKKGEFYRIFSMFFILMPAMSLLAWVIVPIAFMAGDTANPDDVIQFLNTSGIHPVIVMVLALILFVGIVFAAWKRGIPQMWINMLSGKIKQ
ncbi:MAG: hypothetical protein K2O34_07090, partial [Acetatifactor sp.]|nr:hypothetical protein [Acetatifactor sp.]